MPIEPDTERGTHWEATPSPADEIPAPAYAASRPGPGRDAHFYHLHLLTAMFMFALDQMEGAMEIASFGVLTLVTFFVGMVATLPCVLIQRYVSRDPWGAAIAKGMVVGILTALPTGLPGFLTLGWGVVSAVQSKRSSNPSDMN